MENVKVYAMDFARIYPLLLNKAIKKGRTAEKVMQWLTGYLDKRIDELARENKRACNEG